MSENQKLFVIWPAIVAAVVILLALLSWPYGVYTLLKGVTAVIATYYAYELYRVSQSSGIWFWIMVLVAILLNPIIPVHLNDKSIWQIVDVVVGLLFLGMVATLHDKKSK